MEYKNIAIEDFELKVEGDDKGVFTGYGSTFGGTPDSYGDIVEAGAFSQTISKGGANGLGVGMLWSHDSSRPIGAWKELLQDKKGLRVHGKLTIDATDGKDMFHLMKDGAVKGLSIGFTPTDFEIDEKKKRRYLKSVDLWEISPTVFPANTRAKINSVKSFIEEARTERDLEGALREAGLSVSISKYIVKLAKPSLIGMIDKTDESMNQVLVELQKINLGLKI